MLLLEDDDAGWFAPAEELDGWLVPDELDDGWFVPMLELDAVEPLVPEDVEPLLFCCEDIEPDWFMFEPGCELLWSPRLLPELLEALEPALFSAISVCESICPEACRPFDCWNCFSADLVFGPSFPSTGPELKPASLSACWAWLTCELSALADALDLDETFAFDWNGEL